MRKILFVSLLSGLACLSQEALAATTPTTPTTPSCTLDGTSLSTSANCTVAIGVSAAVWGNKPWGDAPQYQFTINLLNKDGKQYSDPTTGIVWEEKFNYGWSGGSNVQTAKLPATLTGDMYFSVLQCPLAPTNSSRFVMPYNTLKALEKKSASHTAGHPKQMILKVPAPSGACTAGPGYIYWTKNLKTLQDSATATNFTAENMGMSSCHSNTDANDAGKFCYDNVPTNTSCNTSACVASQCPTVKSC